MNKPTKNIILRIATPETSGSAFYIQEHNLIVTAEHIVRGHAEIVLDGDEIDRQLAKVVFTDGLADLAFLETSHPLDLPHIVVEKALIPGHDVISAANPFGIGYLEADGQITDRAFEYHGIEYCTHDAVLDNNCNGCPLLTETGQLIGMNNFLFMEGKMVGLSLPMSFILDSIAQYKSLNARYVVRCPQCRHHIIEQHAKNCENCDEIIRMPHVTDNYQPEGIGYTIESILGSMGYTLQLARIGSNHWEVERGSAAINIAYYEKNGLIIGDAYLCKLPPQSNQALYEYLLRQNVEMENLTFSIKGDDIILSLLIYDRYLNEQTGTELLTNLLEMSDHYDNILVEQFHCLWTSSRKLT